MAKIIALVGSESLLGRELREIADSMGLNAALKPVADDEKQSGKMIIADMPDERNESDELLVNADAVGMPLPQSQAAAERGKSKGENGEV